MAVVRRVLLHMENNQRYAVLDTDEGFFLYIWSFEDIPMKNLGLKDYLAVAVKDFARFKSNELPRSYQSISMRDLNLVSGA
jgi:hypothetical protein